MAKNPGESRIPRAARPSFLPKPKIITPLKQHVIGTINGNSRRSTILSGNGLFMNELHEEAIPKTPKGRLSGLPCLASTPNPEGILEQTYVSPPIWGIKGTEALQYDLKRECKEEEEEELFGALHGQLSMLEDISSGCLIEPTLGNTLNETTASGLSATTHQYLSLNKQNSFEHEESLGILTPDQMTDFTVALGCSRTPSCENLTGSRGLLATSVAAAVTTTTTTTTTTITTTTSSSSSSSRGSRPTDVQFTVDNTESHVLISERSPSLEELPLDPKPLDRVEKLFLSEHQANSINNQQTISLVARATTAVSTSAITTSISVTSTASLPMSFVTSVTSITSLEAGYQGDGENSRPASRGPDPPSVPPDNLPGNLPACCHQACPLQDPMTDSDFFTESDADAHEDIVRGDRRAQVIDGTLFCAPTESRRRCPSFAGEEMESSGIYSDLDKRQDERYNIDGEPVSGDQSPDTANTPDTADTADTQVSQKIQTSLNLKPTIMPSLMDFLQVPKNSLDNTMDSNSSGGGGGSDGGLEVTVISVESTNDTNRSVGKLQGKADSPQLKKYKMPNKNVASKIKAMIEASPKEESPKEMRRVARSRKNGHWDAVMSKIEAGKSEQRLRPPRKEVKSRFMQTITSSASISNTPTMSSPSAGTVAPVKRSPGDANNNAKATKDKRRLRGRQEINSPIQETARSSVRSSMSDLSSGPTKETVSKRSITTANQQRRAVNGRTTLKSRVTNKDTKKPLDLSPLHLEKSPNAIRKSALARRSATLNNAINSAKQQSSIPASVIKDSGRRESNSSITISSRVSIDTRQQATQTDSHYESPRIKQAEQTINALCLTIQYLTCQQDEYSEQVQAELDNLNADNVHLKEIISEEREIHEEALNDLRNDVERKYAERIESLDNKLCEERSAFETRLKESMDELIKDHQIAINKLKVNHAAEIEVQHKLYKEEEARQQLLISSKNLREEENEVEVVKKELESLKLCVRPILIMKKRMNEKLKNEKILLMKQLKEKQVKIYNLEAELEELKESNKLIPLDNSSDKSSSLHAEVWSLRSVLELRSQENASMRSEIDILRRDVEGKDTLEQRVESLEARCEDLKAQLQSKESYERTIAHQNEILLGSFHEVSKHNKRLTQRNEELQWRLRQKNEVVSALANQLAAPPRLSRSLGAEHINHSVTPEKNSQASQSSSMIKFMVQKGDSVSWTLEIDESSDSLPNNDSAAPNVSRQNSFRRTPRKSLDIRARSKSVSTSDTMREDNWAPGYNSTPVPVRRRPTSDPSSVNSGVQSSVSVKNEQQNTGGPRPQEAGGEAMISEETSATSSEDESSTSTDISRLAMEFGWSNPVE